MTSKSICITKKQLQATCVAVVLSTLLVLIFGTAFAGLKDGMRDLADYFLFQVTHGFGDTALAIFKKGYYKKILDASSTAELIMKGLQGLAIGATIILMFVKFLTDIQKAQDPVECLFRTMAEFAITICIILFVDDILNGVDEIGNVFLEIFDDSSEAYVMEYTVDDYCREMGIEDNGFAYLGVVFKLIFPYLISYIESLLVRIASYSIIIEMVVRRLFVPFAICDIGYEGLRSSGFRYVKKYFAVYIKQAMVFAVTVAYGQLINIALQAEAESGGVTAGFGAVTDILAIGAACCMIVFKASDWANDVVGA